MAWGWDKDLKDAQQFNEFNSQDRFLNIIMDILANLNNSIIEGDASKMLRAVMALFNSSEFKLKVEKQETKDIKDKINAFAARLIHESQNEPLFKKNLIFYTQTIGELQSELLTLMNAAGMIYPKTQHKTIEETIEDDF